MRRDQRDLEQVAATERVEAVLHAVLAEGDRHPGGHQLADPGGAAPHQPAVAAALEHQVGHRVGDDGDAEPGAVGDHALGVVVVGRGQRADVPDRDPVLPAAALGLRHHHREGAHRAVVGLVDVHVDVGVVALRRARSRAARARAASSSVRSQCGMPPTTSAPRLHRLGHQVGRAGVAQQMPSCGNAIDLHLGDVGAVPRGGEHALERHQPADRVDVDVGAQPGGAGQHRCLDHGAWRAGVRPRRCRRAWPRGSRRSPRAACRRARPAGRGSAPCRGGCGCRRTPAAAGRRRRRPGRRSTAPTPGPTCGDLLVLDHDVDPRAVRQGCVRRSPAAPCGHQTIDRPQWGGGPLPGRGGRAAHPEAGRGRPHHHPADPLARPGAGGGQGGAAHPRRGSGRGWSRSPTSTCSSPRAARWTWSRRPRRWRRTATGSATTTRATPPAP